MTGDVFLFITIIIKLASFIIIIINNAWTVSNVSVLDWSAKHMVIVY